MLTSMKKKRPAGITTRVLLAHMQNMQHVLTQELAGVKRGLEEVRDELRAGMARLDAKIDHNHRLIIMQIDGVDGRVNELEVEFLPRRVKALEVAMRKR